MMTTAVTWLLAMVYPRSRPASASSPRQILLLRPDRLGDVVLSIPAFWAVRQACPAATITAVVTARTAPVLEHHPAVNRLLCVEGDGVWELWRSRRAIRQMRALRAEVAIAFEASWACGWLAYMTGASKRIGWDFRGARGWFTTAVPFQSATVKTHERDAALHLVAALGIAAPPRAPDLYVADSARQEIEQWWTAQQWPTAGVWVMVHPGSRSAYTRWPPERFAQLVDRLQGLADARVALLEGPGESSLVARVQSLLRVPPVRVVRGLALPHLMALLERMDVFIGNATGTTHLAAYLGPRVIEIIGGTHPLDCPERWGVIGERHRIVHARPEDVIGRPTNAWVGPEGLSHIQVDDVWQAVQEIWPHHMI